MLATAFRSAAVRYGADPVALDVRSALRAADPVPAHAVSTPVTPPNVPLHVRLAQREALEAAARATRAPAPVGALGRLLRLAFGV